MKRALSSSLRRLARQVSAATDVWAAWLALLVATAACNGAAPPPQAAEDPYAPAPANVLGGAEGDATRGSYLASIFVCRECHTLRGADGEHLDLGKNFAGGIPFEGPWGVVETANVTLVAPRMPVSVLENTIRGRLAYKFQMPTDLYNFMAADDMADLTAYLRTLPATPRGRPVTHVRADFAPPPPNQGISVAARAPRGRSVERGRYLVTVAICKDCHSPRAADGRGYDEEHLLSGGGFAFRRPDGVEIIPPNLTPDMGTGIGAWSEDDVVRAIRTGIAQDGHRLSPLMPYSVAFFEMTDDDAYSIAAYLKAIPPVVRMLPENPRFSPSDPPVACCFPAPAFSEHARSSVGSQ